MSDHLEQSARQWLVARAVISDALVEMTGWTREVCDANAEAILARLAGKRLLVCEVDLAEEI